MTGRGEAQKQMVVLNEVCKAGGRITLLLVTDTGLGGSLISDPYGPERYILLGVREFGPSRSRFTIIPRCSIHHFCLRVSGLGWRPPISN